MSKTYPNRGSRLPELDVEDSGIELSVSCSYPDTSRTASAVVLAGRERTVTDGFENRSEMLSLNCMFWP